MTFNWLREKADQFQQWFNTLRLTYQLVICLVSGVSIAYGWQFVIAAAVLVLASEAVDRLR